MDVCLRSSYCNHNKEKILGLTDLKLANEENMKNVKAIFNICDINWTLDARH